MQKQILLSITIITLLCSCRKLVTDDFPDIKPQPVLNAIFKAGVPIEAHLSYTENINGDTIALAQDAIVILTEDDITIDTLDHTLEGVYTSHILAQEQRDYHCKAIFTDGTVVTSSTRLPKLKNITAYEHVNEAGRDEEGTIYPSIKVTFENDPTVDCYYQLLINLASTSINYQSEDGGMHYTSYDTYNSPDLLNITDPLIVNEGLPLPVFSNELIEGDSYTMELCYTTGSTSSSNGGPMRTTYFPLTIELRSISYDYYRYAKQLYLYEQGRYPEVIGDVARIYPLYSNIDNGYGIFAAYSTCVTDTIFVD